MSDLGELLVCARRVVHLRPSFVVPVSVRVRRPFKGVFPFPEVARWGLKGSLQLRDRTTFHTGGVAARGRGGSALLYVSCS